MNFDILFPADISDYLNAFNRMDYSAAFERYESSLNPFWEGLSLCGDTGSPVENAVQSAERRITGLWKKRKLCDMQYFLMLYMTPALIGHSEQGRLLAESIQEQWCSRHPDAAYGLGTYAELSSGFNDTILGFRFPGGGRK